MTHLNSGGEGVQVWCYPCSSSSRHSRTSGAWSASIG